MTAFTDCGGSLYQYCLVCCVNTCTINQKISKGFFRVQGGGFITGDEQTFVVGCHSSCHAKMLPSSWDCNHLQNIARFNENVINLFIHLNTVLNSLFIVLTMFKLRPYLYRVQPIH